MAKKVDAYIKLQVKAGQANPQPAGRSGAGPAGVNIMEFCKAVQRGHASWNPAADPGGDHRVLGSQLHLHHQDAAGVGAAPKAIGIEKGSGTPNTEKVGKVTRASSSRRSPRRRCPT
jgi:large subunit ribosomal protein L11